MARSHRNKVPRPVFEAPCDDPQEAKNLTLRAQLMHIIDRFIRANVWTQRDAAKCFGTMQPRISDLQRGRIDKSSIDILLERIERAGWRVDLEVKKRAA